LSNLPSAGLRARIALDKYGFQTTHSLGQNFILDDDFLSHLLDAAAVAKGDCVLEIGPGAGVMTALLAERAEKVQAVELDQRLQPVLADVLSPHDNVHVEFCDFMKTDVDTLTKKAFGDHPYRVVANLPYYITADILLRLTTCGNRPEKIDIMVQKEAAERLLSEPGQKEWCALAATVRAYGSTEILEEVPPETFHPAPHVMSAFIEITKVESPLCDAEEEEMFLKTIQAAFLMRRKTLANNLKSAFRLNQEQTANVIADAGLPDKIRGEALSIEELLSVSRALNRMKNEK